LTLSRTFKMRPTDAEGRDTAGRPVRVPIRWVLPPSASTGPLRLESTVFQGVAEVDCRYADGHLDNCMTRRLEPYNAEFSNTLVAYAEKMTIPQAGHSQGRVMLHFEIERPK